MLPTFCLLVTGRSPASSHVDSRPSPPPVGMFISGHLGDRVDLRHFLTGGCLGRAWLVCLCEVAGFWGAPGILACSLHWLHFVTLTSMRRTQSCCRISCSVCLAWRQRISACTVPLALAGGMLGSGACVALFGAAYFWNIHSMTYFIVVQVAGGKGTVDGGGGGWASRSHTRPVIMITAVALHAATRCYHGRCPVP